jgi:hypothetical protein
MKQKMPFLSAAVVFVFFGVARVSLADTNVALGGTASQSTTGFGGDASRANDGNTDGNFGAGSVTHTDVGDLAPWWQVDLGAEYSISRVVLWNRTDCCQWRLSNFHLSILDSLGTEIEGSDFFTDLTYPDTSFEWLLPTPKTGQTVRIDNLGIDSMGGQFISLAEVQVFSNAANIAPTITTQPKGGKGFIGGSFTFTVEASGSDPLSYQWKRNDANINGVTSSTLTLSPLKATDQGSYSVVVTNPAGSALSDPPADLRVFAGRNLARDGEASQSSTGYGGTPERAIDGNTSGAYGDNTVTHTRDNDPAPSWEVLLFGPSTIEAIFIWNRTDCCPERLHNFRVLVLNADRSEVWHDDFFTDGTFPDTTLGGFEVPFPAGTVGQIVRIEHLGSINGAPLYLALAEVEVIGDGPKPPPDPNLALREGVTATQSSEYNGGQFPASLAINKSLNDFTHTGAGQNLPATWEVNLGVENDIEEIIVWNRKDCCGSRLRDITVSILNLAGDATLFESELLNPENVLGVFPDGPAKLNVNLFDLTGHFVKGGRVRVARTPDPDLSGSGGQGNAEEADILSLAEVQVYTPVDCPALGDTHCNSFFFKVEGPADGGPGAYSVRAVGKDDSGDLVRYTFTADNGRTPPIVVGPQANPQTTLLLGVGHWMVSATADDSLRCDDQAADATCSKAVDVVGKPNNQAPFGVASQSSVGFGGTPERAIDGITDGSYGNGSVTHTSDGDPAPSWEVKLAETFDLEKIVIYNRSDCCSQRLTNFRVSVLTENLDVVYSQDFFTDGSFPDPLTPFEISLPVGVKGRTVRVELIAPDFVPPNEYFLSLAEVEVYSSTGPREKRFHRGDTDNNGQLQLTDAVRILGFLFLGQTSPTCLDAADTDDNGQLQLTDAVRILGFLFLGQIPPEPPGPTTQPCGPDVRLESPDLGCAEYTQCGG